MSRHKTVNLCVATFVLLVLLGAGCSFFRQQEIHKYLVGQPYKISGKWYYPAQNRNYDEYGLASWYGGKFHRRKTANGEIFDKNALSAAHPTLPMPSYVEVTNLSNGKKMVLRINDRGPFVAGRIIDLSERAARRLGFHRQGLAKVRVRAVPPFPASAPEKVK